eukprot:XP_017450649.1 PREDICTED: zinc finger protein 563-like isoform X1 [Rattus norvegicus]
MKGILRNVVSTGNTKRLKNEYQNSGRKLRCQLVEKLHDGKEDHECAEIFKLSTEGTVNHKFHPGVHICQRNGFVNVLIGHLALNV